MEDSSQEVTFTDFVPYVKTVTDAIGNELNDRDVGMYMVALCSVYKVLLRFSKENNLGISEGGIEDWSDVLSRNLEMKSGRPDVES